MIFHFGYFVSGPSKLQFQQLQPIIISLKIAHSKSVIFSIQMEVKIFKSKWKAILSIVVASVSILMVSFYSGFQWIRELSPSFFWFLIITLSLCYPFGFFNIFDSRPYIIFTEHGFRHRLISRDEIKWDSLENASLVAWDEGVWISLDVNKDFLKTVKLFPFRNRVLGSESLEFNVSDANCNVRKILRFMDLMRKSSPAERKKNLINAKLK